MKKFFAIILAVCLLFTGFLTWKNASEKKAAEESTDINELLAQLEAEQGSQSYIDFEAMYKLHAPDEVVLTVGSNEVTWDQLFYYIYSNINYVSQMFSYYGSGVDWSMPVDEEGTKTVSAAMTDMAAENIQQMIAATRFAEAEGVDLTAEQEAELQEYIQSNVTAACGEGATEEDFNEYLKSIYVPRSLFDTMMRWNYLDTNCFEKLYGANGANISDEDAMAFVDEAGYMWANHILFMCMDAEGNALDDAAKAEKLTQAQALAEELRACKDNDELLALFAQRKQELDEDTGKTYYPDGYIFTMSDSYVQEFKDTANALSLYEVSDPVETSYGYHVMLRLPITPDTVIDESYGTTARQAVAEKRYNEDIVAYMNTLEVKFADGFEPVKVEDFIREA